MSDLWKFSSIPCIEESTFCAELNKPGEIKLAQTANMDILYFM